MFWIALVAMIGAVLAQHLGLCEAVAAVLMKIAKCYRCVSFWVSLGVLTYFHCDIFIATMLSILMSYLSNYFGLLLVLLQKVYGKLWQRIEK